MYRVLPWRCQTEYKMCTKWTQWDLDIKQQGDTVIFWYIDPEDDIHGVAMEMSIWIYKLDPMRPWHWIGRGYCGILIYSATCAIRHMSLQTSDKNLLSKVFLLTKLKCEYSEILYILTHFTGSLVSRIWQFPLYSWYICRAREVKMDQQDSLDLKERLEIKEEKVVLDSKEARYKFIVWYKYKNENYNIPMS